MALASRILQDTVAQLQTQRQALADQIASKQQELAALQQQRQQLAAQITDLQAYITAQGG